MLPSSELAHFLATFAAFQTRTCELVESLIGAGGRASLAHVAGDDDTPEWGRWLDQRAHPELHRLREALAASRATIAREQPIRARSHELDALIAALPEQVELRAASGRHEVPLRRWFELELVEAIRLALARLEQALADALDDLCARLGEIERVLDYYTLAIQRHEAELEHAQAEEFARTGLERIHTLIGELQQRREAAAARAKGEFVESGASVIEEASAPFRAHQGELILRRLDEHARRLAAAARPAGLLQRTRAGLARGYRDALPSARQWLAELRMLFGEHDSPALRAQVQALLARDPAELGSELPLGYRRLFTTLPIELADLYVPRPELELACTSAIASWRAGVPQVIVLHGDRGSGKRTLANHVLASVRSQAALELRWVRLGPGLRDEVAVAKALGRALGLDNETLAFSELALEPEAIGRRRVVVVENAERLLGPSIAAVTRMIEFLAMVGQTATSTLWVLLMATPAANLALQRLGLRNRIPTIVEVGAMPAEQLRALLLARHRLSGFELAYDEPALHALDRLTQPWLGLRAHTPSDLFHERLARLSGGNPRQAMYTWLACARPDAQREGRVRMSPLPARSVELLAELGLEQRLVLALLAQHGSLTSAELVEALAGSRESVEGDLAVLWAKGLVARSREHARHWTLRPTIAHPLLVELRSLNMI